MLKIQILIFIFQMNSGKLKEREKISESQLEILNSRQWNSLQNF